MADSTHRCEVFRIKGLTPVPNADTLMLCHFFNYQCIVKKGEFNEGDLAVYIPPDNIVPDNPAYAFLGGHLRIKARRLRGTWSQGLVVAAPAGLKEGDDAAVILGVKHYEPPVPGQSPGSNSRRWLSRSSFEKGPPVEGPCYDIESWWRHSAVLEEGETVEVREKLHGTNARFTYQSGRLWVASRSGYRRSNRRGIPWYVRLLRYFDLGHLVGADPRTPETTYWKAVDQNPWIEDLCKAHEGVVFYGEIFGDVQDLKYGAAKGELFVSIFDAYCGGAFLDMPTLRELVMGDPRFRPVVGAMPPLLYRGPYNAFTIAELISGPTWVSKASEGTAAEPATKGQLREGIVVRPVKTRYAHNLGRVILKAVSPAYLERSKD